MTLHLNFSNATRNSWSIATSYTSNAVIKNKRVLPLNRHKANVRADIPLLPASRPADKSVASATAPDIHGNRYSQLSDNADGSTVSPESKPKISAGLKQEQLEKLPISERKAEVDILRREIWALRAEKKRNRHGVPVAQRGEEAETREQGEEEARMGETRGEEATMEDYGEMGEEEPWTTVRRSRER